MKFLKSLLILSALGLGLSFWLSKPARAAAGELANAVCSTWTQVNLDAFGLGQGSDGSFNGQIYEGYSAEEGFETTVFNNQLYLGMEADNSMGARIWRSKSGVIAPSSQDDWEEVIANPDGLPFGLANPMQADHIDSLESFNGSLFASIANRTGSPLGTRVFRSSSGDPNSWVDAVSSQTSPEGTKLTDASNENFKDMQVFQGQLCGGTGNRIFGAQVWCTSNGSAWSQKNTSGFGNSDNNTIWSGLVFSNTLLFGVQNINNTPNNANDDFGVLYQTSNLNGKPTWTPVFTGTAGSNRIDLLGVFDGELYISDRSPNGIAIFRSPTARAGSWVQANIPGMALNRPNNTNTIVDGAVVFNNELYVSVANTTTGVEVWKTAAGLPGGPVWVQVGSSGLGDAYNLYAELVVFNNALYAWTSNYLTGQQVLRLDCAGKSVETSKIISVSAAPGGCNSLADAIRAANFGATVNGCTGSASTDEIRLTASTSISTPLPLITSTILLDGGGYTLSKSGSGSFSLFSTSPKGYLHLDHLAVSGFSGQNGSVLLNAGRAEIVRSVIRGNISVGEGGAIASTGVLSIFESIFSDNTAGSGGAISSRGAMSIFASTILSNTATISGGGIFSAPPAGAKTVAKLTLLGLNQAPLGPDCSGSLVSQDYNLIQSPQGCGIGGSVLHNIYAADPQIAPIHLNNAYKFQMPSYALLPGSPAIDAAPMEICPTLDFRFFSHAVDYPSVGVFTCDIGAYEIQNPEKNQANVNNTSVDFENTLVSITDGASPGHNHPGFTTVQRLLTQPQGITSSTAVLPFTVVITPTVNTNLDASLSICYTQWEVSRASKIMFSNSALGASRLFSSRDPFQLAASAQPPRIDENSLQLFHLDPLSKAWVLAGKDSRQGHCITKNHVIEFGVWALASTQPTQVIIQELKTFSPTLAASARQSLWWVLPGLLLLALFLLKRLSSAH